MSATPPKQGKPQSAISPTRAENFPEWYQEVIKAADMAENSPVRGCMVIKPWAFAMWEQIQRVLDGEFKRTGHQNAYFPLLIPLSFLQQEAEHVEGFAKECAVVTHHRLQAGPDGKLRPTGELPEPMIIRPTSETIIGASFAKWVQSWRDLPLLINQWCNVMRWEMRTRLFLRTAEFLWQEGHTAHETEAEAREETMRMLGVYESFARDTLAIPVISGEKTAGERFPGAVNTYCIEALMQDGKALQAGTSHFLGQNFSKAADIKFLDRNTQLTHAWTTSWGVSTRLIGALIMAHSDDDGLVLPPRVAPAHAAVLPVLNGKDDARVLAGCRELVDRMRALNYHGRALTLELDARDLRGGDKFWQWVKKGVPVRIEIGPRDLDAGHVVLYRRDKPHKEKAIVPLAELAARLPAILDEMQAGLLARATERRDASSRWVSSEGEIDKLFRGEGAPGFGYCFWAGSPEDEKRLRESLQVTVRCLPLTAPSGIAGQPAGASGPCAVSGKQTGTVAVIGKAY
ncbi:MAG: proline--tRNA ligase [Phycisphaerae bacterium]|nr:proline--tRNA ligase [Phycisphaerae bacterium]